MHTLLLHYDEIGLKGKNREYFERRLVQNLKEKIGRERIPGTVKRMYGRIRIDCKSESDMPFLVNIATSTFGIANCSIAVRTPVRMEEIAQVAEAMLQREEPFATFRITAKRSGDSPISSKAIMDTVGRHIVTNLRKKVNLNEPDRTAWVEIADKDCFVYTKKIAGPGGLPVGASGTGMILLSGGIDSPVASWYAMKRGLLPTYLHFHSYPFTKRQSIEKVCELTKRLDRFHSGSLFLCPFGDMQREIVMRAPDRYRVILYRRMMMRIAERFALAQKAQTLITGESLGQVASQTIENITLTNAVVSLPVLRPLIGFDKKEIIAKAQHIGTYDISILPHEDCCTLFTPKQPEIHGKKKEVEEIEKGLDVEKMIQKGVRDIREGYSSIKDRGLQSEV